MSIDASSQREDGREVRKKTKRNPGCRVPGLPLAHGACCEITRGWRPPELPGERPSSRRWRGACPPHPPCPPAARWPAARSPGPRPASSRRTAPSPTPPRSRGARACPSTAAPRCTSGSSGCPPPAS